jgi:long-subunit acyl-CoA synthetase (AMP-forming)
MCGGRRPPSPPTLALPAHAAAGQSQLSIEGVQLGVNARLAPSEQGRQFRLLGTKWTAGGGELTPTLKPRQQVITARYAAEIDDLYS